MGAEARDERGAEVVFQEPHQGEPGGLGCVVVVVVHAGDGADRGCCSAGRQGDGSVHGYARIFWFRYLQ